MLRRFSLLAVVFLHVFAAFSQTDTNKGTISGTVIDPNSAVIPNASVNVRNTGTNFSREVKTNESGQYRVSLLDPGAYEVTAESSGLAKQTISGLVLNVGSAITVDIMMKLESTTISVEVGETLINTLTPAQSAVVNELAIDNLPINGRRFQDFATLTPTVQFDSSTRNQLSFAGQRGINSNIMLDGADYNQPFFGGIRGGERSNSIITIPQSAVQEFQVVPTGYSAEYGRSTGGVMNTITKSGTNGLHGDGFYQLRHREMSKNNPIFNVQPSETLQQWGGSAGGPVKADKLFWFGAYEQQKANTPRQVFFPLLVGVSSDTEAFRYFKGQEKAFKQTNRALAATGRVDYQFEGGHRLTVRYNISDSVENNAVTVGGDINPFSNFTLGNEGLEKDRTHNGTIQYTRLLSPTVINDLRFTGSYEIRPRLANEEAPGVTTTIGNFGTRTFMPTTQDDKRYQFTDSISATRGNHTIKIGGDYSRISTGQAFGFNQFGTFNINLTGAANVATVLDILSPGGSIANRFDSSAVTYTRQIGNLLANFGAHQFALFAQDSWRATPKLTLDFGVRWEAQWNPTAEANNTPVIDRIKGVRFPNGLTVDPTTIRDSLKQVMPRFGFAWTPMSGSHRTVVRGHAGIFYAATPLIVFAAPNNNFRTPPGDVGIAVGGGSALTVYQSFLQAGVDLNATAINALPIIPLEAVQRASAIALGGSARDPFIGAGFIPAASDFRNPRSFQSGLGFDTELFRNLIAGVQINYVNTVHLTRNRDYNLPAPIILAGDATARPNIGFRNAPGIRNAVPRPVSTVGALTVRESSARSMYRAMTFQGQYRARRLQFGAFYTISENFSDDDGERESTTVLYADPFNFKQDYGYASIDARHQFTSNAVATLPWGFETAAIWRVRSGNPLNPRTGADENQDNISNDRPYSAAGVIFERNSFRNRAFQRTDFRIVKNFSIGENKRVQFSTEFFNLFNVDNVRFNSNAGIYGPGLQPNGTTAPIDARFQSLRTSTGVYNTTTTEQVGNPLQVQFGLRFFF